MREKTGGRKKGVPNKTTTELRELLTSFVSTNMETIQQDFEQLESKDRIVMLEKFLKYVLSPIKQEEEEKQPWSGMSTIINWGSDDE